MTDKTSLYDTFLRPTHHNRRAHMLEFNSELECNDTHLLHALARLIDRDPTPQFGITTSAVRMLLRHERNKMKLLGEHYNPSWFVKTFIRSQKDLDDFPTYEVAIQQDNIVIKNFYALLRPGWWYHATADYIYFYPGLQKMFSGLVSAFEDRVAVAATNKFDIVIPIKQSGHVVHTFVIPTTNILTDLTFIGEETIQNKDPHEYLRQFVIEYYHQVDREFNIVALMKALSNRGQENDGSDLFAQRLQIYSQCVSDSVSTYLNTLEHQLALST